MERRAEATVAASISGMGIASGQHEKRSIHVRHEVFKRCP